MRADKLCKNPIDASDCSTNMHYKKIAPSRAEAMVRNVTPIHRISDASPGRIMLAPINDPDLLLGGGNTFQKRNVSSPAPVTMDWPSGLIARYKTRKVCPVMVANLVMDGYFHTMIWFKL